MDIRALSGWRKPTKEEQRNVAVKLRADKIFISRFILKISIALLVIGIQFIYFVNSYFRLAIVLILSVNFINSIFSYEKFYLRVKFGLFKVYDCVLNSIYGEDSNYKVSLSCLDGSKIEPVYVPSNSSRYINRLGNYVGSKIGVVKVGHTYFVDSLRGL